MDRIIEVKVKGSCLTRDSQTAGVQGEVNAAALRLEFDPGWDGMAKTITWWNARGEEEVKRILTTEQLEDLSASGRVYLTTIPGEAMTEAGRCRFAIDGYVEGKRRRSVYSELVVRPSGGGRQPVDDPTPTQAEQLQVQMDTVLETLQEGLRAAVHAESAAAVAMDCAESAADALEEARSCEGEARRSEASASASEYDAQRRAEEARSYACGDTGSRPGEETDNARYYMEQARKMAGGEFLTAGELETRLAQLTAAALGAAEDIHSHSAAQITEGTLAAARLPTATVSKGGTGRTTLAAGSYLVGNGTSSVAMKTAAQVLADIGAAAAGHSHSAAAVGAVPTTRTVNGRPLSGDVVLSATDVGARSDTWMPTADEVGARSNKWMPTAAEVGAAPVTERARTVQGQSASVGAKGWYRIATMYTLDSALFCVGNSHTSGGPSRLLFFVYPNSTKSGIVVLSNTVPNVNIITQIRVVSLGGSQYGVDVYYNRTTANTMYASGVCFTVAGSSGLAMERWTAATDGTALCTVQVGDMPSGMVLTSGSTYRDLGLLPRFRGLQSGEDDLNDFLDDGVIVYNTGDAPGNAPFSNASVGLCIGSDSTTNQRIQLVSRYGVSGYLRVRGYSVSQSNPEGWLPWADLLSTANVVSGQADITAGAAVDWQQYLVYE